MGTQGCGRSGIAGKGRAKRARIAMAAALVLLAPATMAATFAVVYNGPTQVVGDTTYYNGANLGVVLISSNLILTADETVTVADAVDLSHGGAATKNLILNAVEGVEFDYDLTMGTGNLILETDLVNLTGRVFGFDGVDTIALPASRLAGCSHTWSGATCTTTHVNVLGDLAFIEQGLAFSTGDGSVDVFDGIPVSTSKPEPKSWIIDASPP